MIITCPSCSTGYLLPEHLVGPGGARVRCPRCQFLFAVDVDGRPRESAPAPSIRPSERPLEAVPETPGVPDPPVAGAEPKAVAGPPGPEHLAVARAVLEQFALDRSGAIERAQAEHRFFAEFGPALMVAYEAYRSRAGEGAGPSAFRTVLRERWGVELVPLAAREG